MKRFEVIVLPQAEADLFNLYHYIAEEAGRAVAGADIERIEAACLATRLGLRTMGFERRATIVFQVLEPQVAIARVLYGGRDFERILQALS